MKKFIAIFLLILLSIPSLVLAAPAPETNCPYIVLLDFDTGRVLYNKNMYAKCYPASTTKIMTAIIALENCELTETCLVSYKAINSVPADGSNVALKVGEEFTIQDLLLGMMVASGNDAANVVAEHVEEKLHVPFEDLMNEKAKAIGCVSTNFVNPSGIHNDNHYSCAYDMAIIYRYGIQNFDALRRASSTLKFTLPTTSKHTEDDRRFDNTNKLIIPSSATTQNYYYEYAIGGKTGFTTPAKNCLVSQATKGDFNLICSIMGGGQDSNGNSYRYIDAKNLFEWGFSDLVKTNIVTKGNLAQKVLVQNAKEDQQYLDLVYEESLNLTLSLSDSLNVYTPEITIFSGDVLAPVEKGALLGKAEFKIYDTNYSVNLLADQSIEEKAKIAEIIVQALLNIVKFAGITLVVLIILILIIRFYNLHIKKRRRRAKASRARYNARFRR